MSSVVTLERTGEIAVMRLNRPDRLNAFTAEMCEEMLAAFDACDADDSVRAVVLTGNGRAFCAGADLADGPARFMLDEDPDTGRAPADNGGRVSLRIFHSSKPVVVAINGPAAGVGVTMTLPADIRIASQTAKFRFPFAGIGLVPEGCSTWFLPRVVGISTALEWAVGAKMISADEALRRGLVREVVPVDEVLPRALELARELVAGTSPVSVALTRALMWRMLGADAPEVAHRAESTGIYVRGRSDDVREGVAAFLEKRAPSFPQSVSGGVPNLFE